MLTVREGVDHRHVGVSGQFLDGVVLERTRSDDIDVAAEHAGHVGGGLPLAQPHLWRRQVEALATQWAHRHLKAHPRAQGGLLEHEGQRLAPKHRRRLAVLQADGHVHDRQHLVSRKIADREKVSPAQFLNLTLA
jgi:hypothetical protein